MRRRPVFGALTTRVRSCTCPQRRSSASPGRNPARPARRRALRRAARARAVVQRRQGERPDRIALWHLRLASHARRVVEDAPSVARCRMLPRTASALRTAWGPTPEARRSVCHRAIRSGVISRSSTDAHGRSRLVRGEATLCDRVPPRLERNQPRPAALAERHSRVPPRSIPCCAFRAPGGVIGVGYGPGRDARVP